MPTPPGEKARQEHLFVLLGVEPADNAAAVAGLSGEDEVRDLAPVETLGEQLDHLDVLREHNHLEAAVKRLVEDFVEDLGLGGLRSFFLAALDQRRVIADLFEAGEECEDVHVRDLFPFVLHAAPRSRPNGRRGSGGRALPARASNRQYLRSSTFSGRSERTCSLTLRRVSTPRRCRRTCNWWWVGSR